MCTQDYIKSATYKNSGSSDLSNDPEFLYAADKGIKYHRGNRKSDGTKNVRKIVCSAYRPKNDPECEHSDADNAKEQDSSLLFLKKVPDQIY